MIKYRIFIDSTNILYVESNVYVLRIVLWKLHISSLSLSLITHICLFPFFFFIFFLLEPLIKMTFSFQY